MKRFLTFILSALLILALCACGSAGPVEAEREASVSPPPMEIAEPTPDPPATSEEPEAAEPSAEETAPPRNYVLNTSTMKYHSPSCPSVKDIAPGNYKEFTGYPEDLEEEGYSPCGRCNPR